ncbi:MAG: PolC-type DNA polymerase III [Streptococcaceae bacterium]|jgi:DNA polymerase-3 subunit alpha (Gram-positive type)|nr:PolC-type DNA polymerase III [Streptococcaceae bacterium]
MVNDLFEKLLDQIKLDIDLRRSDEFKGASLKQVEVDFEQHFWHFFVRFPKILPFEMYQQFRYQLFSTFRDKARIELTIQTDDGAFSDELLQSYWGQIFQEENCNLPIISGTFKVAKPRLAEDGKILLLMNNAGNIDSLQQKYLPIITAQLQRYGFGCSDISPIVDETMVAESLEMQASREIELIEQQQQEQVYNKPVKKNPAKISDTFKMGRNIKDSEVVTAMKEVIDEANQLVFEGNIFDFEVRETRKGKKFLNFKMTDYTSSFSCQKWSRNDDDAALFELVKKNMWVRVRGNVEMNDFQKEYVMNVQDIQEIVHEARRDLMPKDEKRIEFHAHTNMSTMDAIPTAKDLVAKAKSFGHSAIAITDHAGLQSFPEAYQAGKAHDVKILYGVEINLVDDQVPIVYHPVSRNLKEANYVVFDVETTGTSAVYNKLIQVAASKMHKGNVIASFNMFIDPGHPLSPFTVSLTKITDEMIKEKAKPLAFVLEEFQKFCEGSILVAHNASFDVGFMNVNYQRHGLPEITQPVIDTLEFSRNLNPEIKRHGLGPLTKRFKIILENHHQADADAEATGRLLFIFLEDALERLGVSDLIDLNVKVVDKFSYKRARPTHATVYAKTQAGLKHLFQMVSESNVHYFERVPRVPKSLLVKLREGLIVGSACEKGEVFDAVLSKGYEAAKEIAAFYDFIEVMPKSVYQPLIEKETIKDESELESILCDLIRLGEELDRPVLATGNVHYLDEEDAVFREIIVRGLGPGNEINRPMRIGGNERMIALPKVHFRTTDEMLDEFHFLGEAKARELVITNPKRLAESFEKITPVKKDLYTPYIEGSEEQIVKMTYDNAFEMYGNPLPDLVDLRIEKELKSIIGNGFAVIYLISQKLVKKSNDDGYLVGSRGSVGSSFVATMTGITEVNPLAPHYVCPNCKYSEFYDDGTFGSGYDMPEKNCPKCDARLHKDGHDIPFETFLGFYGDKVPDIDLNFSGEYQPQAHNYTKEIFGEDYAYRAGTIGTVAERTAFGFVSGYEEDYHKSFSNAEKTRLALGSNGVKRTTGQHPGGIIVIPSYMDVNDFSPIQYPADDVTSEWKTTHFDFHSIHDNILKLDILGHDDPTMIRMLQDLSGIDPKTIPADDPEVMKIFSSPEVLGVSAQQIFSKTGTLGVPEFGTSFVRGMLEETHPKTFAELLQISGLSHGTDVWLGNAQELIKNKTANLANVIGCRDDIMVYLIHAGLESGLAFKIMEGVRKGKGIPDEWQTEMRKQNVPEWYIDSCLKIKYMFPKAHAAAYVLMALRVAWFKVHQPIYYYCAYFSIRAAAFDIGVMTEGKESVKRKMTEIREKGNEASKVEVALLGTLEICNEMLERGFTFAKLDLYHSAADHFIISDDGKSLIPPFTTVDGLGLNVANQIVAARSDGEFLSKNELKSRARVSSTLIEKFDSLGILHNIPEDNQLTLFDDLGW